MAFSSCDSAFGALRTTAKASQLACQTDRGEGKGRAAKEIIRRSGARLVARVAAGQAIGARSGCPWTHQPLEGD